MPAWKPSRLLTLYMNSRLLHGNLWLCIKMLLRIANSRTYLYCGAGQTAGAAAAGAAAGRGPIVCVDVLATHCGDMTRGSCEEAGLIVLNGGLGAAGWIAPAVFWNG